MATLDLRLAVAEPQRISCLPCIHVWRTEAKVIERKRVNRLVLSIRVSAVAIVVAYPLISIGDIATSDPPIHGPWLVALVLTACFLPLHVRHVLCVVRGAEPPLVRWTLVAMAIVILGGLPFIGLGWSMNFHVLAVSALMLLPTIWAVGIFAVLVLAPIPLAFVFGGPQLGPYLSVAVAWRSLSPFVIIWLAAAIRQLDAARARLAEEAVTRERLRIDAEIRETLGGSLELVVQGAEHVSLLIAGPAGPTEAALRQVVDRSRQSLAVARRLISGYQQVSLRAELDSAAALLSAAGIQTRVQLDDAALPSSLRTNIRAELRTATARLLREGTARTCVIAIVGHGERAQLELWSDGHELLVEPGTAP